jgi:hypothetical protein
LLPDRDIATGERLQKLHSNEAQALREAGDLLKSSACQARQVE